ncbi:uncharacterized protein MELLADRAFT_108321 [Melampsora larici-populina 98AG31]|uniref:Uncharacterized protein n=1 Tax=Melampsora larici-populina (strain 98AG31 / pathotype 3-4-7) TaxID=747676 RepID=F4RSQ2_MELLP|nr:uncharacterized protein MELLADRAFT_108321 [Melampsora larici-populina 98AG31]EGG04657.1 hypothetical protein MELLADRAFT_108321 [Melampsora larici-populina 98AG31]
MLSWTTNIIRKQLDKAKLEGIYPEDQPSALPHLVPDTDALTECPEDESSEPSSDRRMSYPRAAKSQTSTTTILSHPTTTNRSDASDSSSSTILGAHGPALTPHELKLIHISIEQAITPSWLPVVPSLFGTTVHGSVKAVQWLVLYTVYMVFSLIPYHANAEPNSDSQKIHTAILLATQIINISVSRVMSEEDIQSLGLLLKTYRQHLQTVWPNIKSKPNLHFAQHLPNQCRRLGPPPYTAAWVGERLIGTLVQTPKNFCAANLSITSRNSATRWKEFSPPGDVLHAVKELLQSNSSVSSASIDLMSTSLWRHSGKSYSISSRHLGNSYIEYHINGKRGFGSIEHIVRLVSDSLPIFVVQAFLPLQPSDQIQNPYHLSPHLKADLMYEQTERRCLYLQSMFGHCAAIKNPAGTFAINKPTVQLIGLRSMGIWDMASSGFGEI